MKICYSIFPLFMTFCYFGIISTADAAIQWKAKSLRSDQTTATMALPPGLSFTPATGPLTNIAGTPTTPGTYRVVVYPYDTVTSQNGDMVQFQIGIVPRGSTPLPQYYGYLRNPLAFSSVFSGLWSSSVNFAIAATSGRVLFVSPASNGAIQLYFTSDGETFVRAFKPDSFRKIGIDQAAGASGTFLCFDSEAEIFIKCSSGTTFTVTPLTHPKLDTSLNQIKLVSDGTKIYLFQLDRDTNELCIFDTNLGGTINLIFCGPVNSNLQELDVPSAASNSGVVLFAVGDTDANNNQISVLVRKDVANSAAEVVGASVASVGFGSGKFLGSSFQGVFTSPDGISWTPTGCTQYSGAITYARSLFFSPRLGVSRDGISWREYANFPEKDIYGLQFRVLSSGSTPTSMLFFGNRQLSSNQVPNFKSISINPIYDRSYVGVVGTIFSGPTVELNPY